MSYGILYQRWTRSDDSPVYTIIRIQVKRKTKQNSKLFDVQEISFSHKNLYKNIYALMLSIQNNKIHLILESFKDILMPTNENNPLYSTILNGARAYFTFFS